MRQISKCEEEQMEEDKDIKILEEKIKIIESLCTDDCINKSTVIDPLKYALENLITRYKQLEEENKSKQKAYDDCYCEYKHYKQFDSIPKSKVKEKIAELDNVNNAEALEDLMNNKNYTITQLARYVLEELLREEQGR